MATPALGIAVAANARRACGCKAIFVTMAAHTVMAHFMRMIDRAVIGVMSRLRVTDLTNPIPRRISLVKSVVGRFLLKNH